MSITMETTGAGRTDPVPGTEQPTPDVEPKKVTEQFIPEPKSPERSGNIGLHQPTVSIADVDMSRFVGIPSPGADILALLSELNDEQRRANREQIMAQRQAAVANLEQQADNIRQQAVANMVMGLVSAGIQITASAGSAFATGKAIANTASVSDSGLRAALLQAQTSKIQGTSQAVGGLAQGLDAVRGFVSSQFDASMKEKEAQLEMIRAMTAQLESLDDALKEVIRKARDTQDATQQSVNQTRMRILG